MACMDRSSAGMICNPRLASYEVLGVHSWEYPEENFFLVDNRWVKGTEDHFSEVKFKSDGQEGKVLASPRSCSRLPNSAYT